MINDNKRGAAIYKGEILRGRIVEECHGKVAIYPDGETGNIDDTAFVFDRKEVIFEDKSEVTLPVKPSKNTS